MEEGGRGSGHWGHAGRPGKLGGSLPRSDAGSSGRPRVVSKALLYRALGSELPPRMSGGLFDRYSVARKLSETSGVPRQDAADVIGSWGTTANGSLLAISLQSNAAAVFGATLSPYQQTVADTWKGYDLTGGPSPENQQRLLREMYAQTQKRFSDMGYGPDDAVRIYRGVRLVGPLWDIEQMGATAVGDYTGNVLESWTADLEKAGVFASIRGHYNVTHGYVLEALVPVRDLVSVPPVGMGTDDEYELVILGRPTRAVRATRRA